MQQIPAKSRPELRARQIPAWLPFVCAGALAVLVYLPALHGPFVFDDLFLPYGDPSRVSSPLYDWIAGVRPLLYFSFWLNHQISGSHTWSYHALNLLLHALNAALVFFIAGHLLRLARASARLAWIPAALFLLHPVQTESVAYIAGRSETLAAFFLLSAWALFVKRLPGASSWRQSIWIILLFLAACATKEHAIVLLPILLLTDYFWNAPPGWTGIRANWRIYLPIGIGSLLAALAAWKVLAGALTAGFHLPDLTWYQYFFTECRVFFKYLRLFLLPIHQTVDYDIPVSRTVFDHAACYALLAIVLILCAAVYFLRRYPLAAYGTLLFVILLAPASSFIPLRDPLVEHRMYLPIFALSLVLLDILRRIAYKPLAASALVILAICGLQSWRRNHVWAATESLWQDAIAQSPNKLRPYTSLALYYMHEGRCADAAHLYELAPAGIRTQYNSLIVAGEAQGCLGRFAAAAGMLEQAAKIQPESHLYVQLGDMCVRAGQSLEAFAAFTRAIQLNPSSKEAYLARARWYEHAGQFSDAAADYRYVLQLNPANQTARILLEVVERRAGEAARMSPEHRTTSPIGSVKP